MHWNAWNVLAVFDWPSRWAAQISFLSFSFRFRPEWRFVPNSEVEKFLKNGLDSFWRRVEVLKIGNFCKVLADGMQLSTLLSILLSTLPSAPPSSLLSLCKLVEMDISVTLVTLVTWDSRVFRMSFLNNESKERENDFIPIKIFQKVKPSVKEELEI